MDTRRCCGLVVVIGALASSATALEVRQNVAFSTVNQNPWSPGAAFVDTFHFDDLRTTFNVDLPDLTGDPAGLAFDLIGDFLDVELPLGLGVKAGGTVQGDFGLDFGYHVNGGRFHMKYPALSSLDVATFRNTGAIVANQDNRISTSFRPGIEKIQTGGLTRAALIATGGGGYGEQNLNGLGFEQFETPEFSTEFPYAAAWADLNYQVNAGAFVEARAFLFKARKEFSFGAGDSVRLAAINPTGVYVGGDAFGLKLDEPLGLGGLGSVTFSYPDVKVKSESMRADGSLHGFASKPVISFQGQLEKLVPLVGSVLSNSVGPIGYTLLETSGGPSLNLYQDFTFTPEPRVVLHFSEPVQERLADGSLRETMTIERALGESVDIQPIFGPSDAIVVQPTYLLHNTFRNETGLSLGVNFDLDVLELTTPIGNLGPAVHEDLDFNDLARLPVYTRQFDMPLGSVAGRPFSVPKANLPIDLGVGEARLFRMGGPTATFLGRDPANGLATYRIAAVEAETDTQVEFEVTGVETTFIDVSDATFDFQQTVLLTDQDVLLNDPVSGLPIANLGRRFCVFCPDASALFDNSNALDVGDTTLHVSPLFDFPSGVVDVQADPILSQNNYFQNTIAVETLVAETLVTSIAAREDVLFSNLNEPQRDYTPIATPEYWAAQSFTTDDRQYSLRSIQALVGNAADDPDIVAQLYNADEFLIGDLVTDFTTPELSADRDAYSFVPESEVMLDPNTVYWFVLGSRTGSFDWAYEDSGSGQGTNTFGPGSLVLFADSSDAGQTWTYYSLLNPYQLQINVAAAASPAGDVTADGLVTVDDIDAVAAAVRIGDESPLYDLNRDGQVTLDDHRFLIVSLKQTLLGDADLNHEVGFPDFLALSANFGGPGGWGQGDFDADGLVLFADFLLLADNFGGTPGKLQAVPEPNAFPLLLTCLLVIAGPCLRGRQEAYFTEGARPNTR